MKLTSMSASSIKVFQSCEAKWKATYEGARDRGESGEAARMGSACHGGLEDWIASSVGPFNEFRTLREAYVDWVAQNETVYPKWHDEGIEILENWYDRQNWAEWTERTVLSTEYEFTFPVDTSIGPIPFRGFIDRVDRLDDGDYEVVDYKSGMFMLSPDELTRDVQAKSYALAVWLQYGEPKRVWVTFDYLRTDTSPKSVSFTAKQCLRHLAWLTEIAEEIIASDGLTETPNMCQWCPRIADCDRIIELSDSHIEGLDLDLLGAMRSQIATATKGLDTLKGRIDDKLRLMLDESDEPEFYEGDTQVRMTLGRRQKSVDISKALAALGVDDIDLPLKITGGEFEKFIKRAKKDETLTPEQIAGLESAIETTRGTPQLKVVKT